ncbi:transcriptional regulator [Bacillus sp. FJAT-21945]|nr:transcriptional regulator [Bacillus sp. FJAT-21945]
MKFFIADDSYSIRAMLSEIIEEEELGTVKGEAEDGIEISRELLSVKEIDILLIDLLMPERDGIETIRELGPLFKGKTIMISQVDAKEMVAEAYSLGIEYYITKPINKCEVVTVIKKVTEHYLREKSIINIQDSLKSLAGFQTEGMVHKEQEDPAMLVVSSGKSILLDLGIVGDCGYRDLLAIIKYLYSLEKHKDGTPFPPLKTLFEKVAENLLEIENDESSLKREMKACEQRVRRIIHRALEHVASLGLTDYTNPKFELYASTFFDYSVIRKKMLEIEGKSNGNMMPLRVNIKKFIEVLYMEAIELSDGKN